MNLEKNTFFLALYRLLIYKFLQKKLNIKLLLIKHKISTKSKLNIY